jgi:hypothetical protein
MSVSPEFEKGLSRKSDIEALKAGKRQPEAGNKLPSWLTDAFNLLLAGGIGGACAWIAIRFLV